MRSGPPTAIAAAASVRLPLTCDDAVLMVYATGNVKLAWGTENAPTLDVQFDAGTRNSRALLRPAFADVLVVEDAAGGVLITWTAFPWPPPAGLTAL